MDLHAIARLVLQEHPELVRLHGAGKTVLGRMVGLMVEKAPRGTAVDEIKLVAIEALLTHGQNRLVLPAEAPLVRNTEAPKTELTVLSMDQPSKRMNAGWKLFEQLPSDAEGPEGKLNLSRWGETDLADRYWTHHARPYVQEGETDEEKRCGWMTIPVLEFLKGRPWNNAALNLVRALRPSCIRVTTGPIKTDACSWRVTVTVDERDKRTIKDIEQEVEVGIVGCRFGADVADYIEGRTPPSKVGGIVNPRGLKKLATST
jgi:hypothetical protein